MNRFAGERWRRGGKVLAAGWVALLVLLSMAVAGIQTGWSMSPGMEKKNTIEGRVWYRERMLLPPGSEVIVYLEDVAKMDVPSELIARTTVPADGAPPYSFELNYDPQKINQRGRYSLRAKIESGGRLLFTSTEQIPAFEHQPVEIRVSHVAGSKASASDAASTMPNAKLTNTYWKLLKMNGEAVTMGAGQRELQMTLTEEGRVRGFSGCNQFTGEYILEGNGLSFPALASTRMACVAGMDQEDRFQRLIGKTASFKISGQHLILYDEGDQPILDFIAVYLN